MTLLPAEIAHLELLERWRQAMDLIGPGPSRPHAEDCAQAVGWLTLEEGERWADLGSGAGFPGISLAARHPQIHVSLVESRSKRAAFLRQASAELPNVQVLHQRSEKLPPESFDGVTARAYRAPEDLLGQALGLLRPGGVAVVLVARQEPVEVPGFTMFHVERYEVGGRPRAALGYRKDT